MKNITVLLVLVMSIPLLSVVVNWDDLSPAQQGMAQADLAGRVNCEQDFVDYQPQGQGLRVLPELAEGWPVMYTVSNCYKGAIYTNMDEDPEVEIIYGVGTKIVALNLDGSNVPGWPQQLAYYIWSSPACGDIDGDGELEIVGCSRNNTTGNEGELYAFELDGSAVTGFPVTMAGGGTMNACLADLDNDEDLEIFVNVRNHPDGWTYVYDGDGSVYEGWPQQLDTFPGSSISVGDITGDDIPEVVGLSYESLYAFDAAGNILDGFPVYVTGYNYSYSQPILADLDDDGMREIIYGGCSDNGGALMVIKNDGSALAGFPQTVGQWIFATPALADLDGDDDLEIIIGDQVSSSTPTNFIYAWHADGSSVDGFPAGPANAIYAQAGIADLDGDELPEIMIDDNVFGNGYECYNNDGSHCDEWPLACGTGWDSITMQMTPVFGDFDQDGFLEIAGAATGFTSWIVECCLWNTESEWNEDLAYMPLDGCNISHSGVYPQTMLPPPPQAPESCSTAIYDYNDVLVEWEMEESGQSGFMIYINGQAAAEISDPLLREYDLYAFDQGEYECRVTAVYDEQESDPSPASTFNILLTAPGNITYDLACETVFLYWDAPAVRNLTSYNIYRDDELIGSTEELTYTDTGLLEDTYTYYLTAVYSDSLESMPSESIEVSVTSEDDDVINPAAIRISNYPNPFNPHTKISFELPETQCAIIEIYNVTGQLVKTYPPSQYQAGINEIWWDGSSSQNLPLSTGVYFLKITTNNTSVNHKLLLLK